MDPQSHAATRALLPSYAANQLTPSERGAVERHIATCAGCRDELRQWLTLGEWLARDDAAIPPDTSAARGLAAIHTRLRQSPEHSLNGFDHFDHFERSALPTMSDQDSPREPTGQHETPRAPTLRERHAITGPSGGAPSRPLQPQRRIPSVAAVASVVVFLALVASLFYLVAPQLRPRQTSLAPTATATTQLTPTPKPTSGSWRTAPAPPAAAFGMQFAKSAPQIGYLCDTIAVGADSTPTPSSQWLYKTSDGGMTWRPVGGLTPPDLAAMDCQVFIAANDANDVFVQLVCMGDTSPLPCESLWRSRDGGASWSRLAMPQMPWGWANIAVVGSRIVGLGTDDNLARNLNGPTCTTSPSSPDPHQINDLFASDDGGKTWKQIGQPLINQGLSIIPGGEGGFTFGWSSSPSPSLLSAGKALFVRTFCLDGHSASGEWRFQQTYWRSGDGGATWTKLATPDSNMSLTPSATGGAYGVTISSNITLSPPVIQYSRDSGASWSALPSLDTIPLPSRITKSAPGCVTTCYTSYMRPNAWLAIALPDGSVLVNFYVHDAKTNATVDALYAIDPQSPHPAWRQFASAELGSTSIAWLTGWPLAATRQGLVLWATAVDSQLPLTSVYLSPLP